MTKRGFFRLGFTRVLGWWQRGPGEQLGSAPGRSSAAQGARSHASQASQQQQAGQLGPQSLWGREVSFKPGTVALLVLSSAYIGSQANMHWSELQPRWQLSSGVSGENVKATIAGYLRSFQAHSQHDLPPPDALPPPSAAPLSPFFIADAAARAAPAVVNIMVQSNGMFPTGSSGSGFIVDADGTILTNAHVVADAIHGKQHGGAAPAAGAPHAKGITVTLQDGRIFEGQLVNYDTVSDLAVIKIDSDVPLPMVKLGKSSGLRMGEWVVALGSPLHLQNSVTAGIVSCVDRKAVELGLVGARTDYIQTDAAINKGNSGGPLVNLYGEVIGISAMKALAADGVSFAIPIDTATDVMRQLKTFGRVIRPYAGMKMLQLNRHNAAQFRRRDPNFPDVSSGILVPQVYPGSPAAQAGLKAGDIIIGFSSEHRDVTTSNLVKALGEHVGKPLTLKVVRPHNEVVMLQITAQEAMDSHH